MTLSQTICKWAVQENGLQKMSRVGHAIMVSIYTIIIVWLAFVLVENIFSIHQTIGIGRIMWPIVKFTCIFSTGLLFGDMAHYSMKYEISFLASFHSEVVYQIFVAKNFRKLLKIGGLKLSKEAASELPWIRIRIFNNHTAVQKVNKILANLATNFQIQAKKEAGSQTSGTLSALKTKFWQAWSLANLFKVPVLASSKEYYFWEKARLAFPGLNTYSPHGSAKKIDPSDNFYYFAQDILSTMVYKFTSLSEEICKKLSYPERYIIIAALMKGEAVDVADKDQTVISLIQDLSAVIAEHYALIEKIRGYKLNYKSSWSYWDKHLPLLVYNCYLFGCWSSVSCDMLKEYLGDITKFKSTYFLKNQEVEA